jgi:hypothetical protein
MTSRIASGANGFVMNRSAWPRRGREVADLRQHVEAAHPRQTDVEQHHVERRGGGELGERRDPIGGLHHDVAGFLEKRGHRVTKRAIVIDDQNAAPRGHARSHGKDP